MVELLQITILLVAAVPLLAIVQPFMAPVEGIGIIVVTIVLLIAVVTRSARRMQGQIRNATRLIAAALGRAHAGPDGELSYDVPGIGMITPISLRADSEGVGRKLSELDLHTNSGAVVVAIGRGDSEVIVPTGEEILQSGDILELAGSTGAVAAARRLLDSPRPAQHQAL
jgi:CPA2 family monovalent cation:H+ antiporter-2